MKYLTTLLILSFSVLSVSAENFFQNSNPFPQTTPQTMNNIYESEPATIKKEAEQAKKSWFKKGKNLQKHEDEINNRASIPVYPVEYEGNKNNGDFYIFTTK